MNQGKKTKIIVICGPTAVGKTSEAIKVAKNYNGEIINADSRQIYRFMDIGTAKPSPSQMDEVPHHLIDLINPDQHFDASRFGHMARHIINDLATKNRLPFLVGGTGLYIKSALYGLFENHQVDLSVRQRLQRQAETHGKHFIYERLKRVDPETAERLHVNDIYRVIRALEVYETSGNPISKFHHRHHFAKRLYRSLKIGLYLGRETLYKRIDQRVDIMISEGLVEEVKSLVKQGYSQNLKAMKAIGYHHVTGYLNGQYTLEEAIELLKRDTRRYAKRQMTWFRKDPEIHWTKPGQTAELVELVHNFLKT